MSRRRVVVTGIGALTPIGNSLQEYWNGLTNGVSGAAPISLFDASLFKTQFACEVKIFDPSAYFDRKEVRKMDRFAQFAMVVSDEAINDSKLKDFEFNPDRIGVIFGSGIGGITTFQEEVRNYVNGNGVPRYNPFFIPKMIADIAAGNISIKHGFRGPNFCTVSACASATHAIIDSVNYIQLGKADVIITGGAEASVCESGVGGFNAMHALSTRNDEPETASRPFDSTRDGFVLGEGAGCLVLEDLEHALKRGAAIYGEFAGGGLSADAHHLTAPHPEGLGAFNVMKNALEDGGLSAEDIDYVNVHGTSTPLGDIAESIAIKRVFGDHAYNLNISSTKSMTGHLLGAAGAIEAIASLMAVKEDIVPPTINHKNPDQEIDEKLNFTFNKAQKREVRAALSNTFGFGGHNASIIFKKYSA